jgi:UDP-N-acetylmuramate dehydrogenase
MKVKERPSLRALNTFGVEASAQLLLTVESEEDLRSLPAFNPGRDLVLGGGSNVVFVTDIPGTVYLNRIVGKHLVEDNGDHVVIESGAGENWHDLVRWTLNQGLCGLENLSLIPGLAGAAPMQNIGAYGVDLSSVLDSVTAWDWQRARWVSFNCEECRFGYRDSRFKSAEPGRFLITSIRLKLSRSFTPQLNYAGLRDELSAAGVERPSAADVSEAVIRIRQRKLPDPIEAGNAGSFFKNPVVGRDEAEALQSRYPGLPLWPLNEGQSRLSAAWMIESCGLKGLSENDATVSTRHALVIVNQGAATGREIAELAKKVQTTVHQEFGITLEPEPRLVAFNS